MTQLAMQLAAVKARQDKYDNTIAAVIGVVFLAVGGALLKLVILK